MNVDLEAETVDAIWASAERIREMMKSGEMLSEWFCPYFEEMTGFRKASGLDYF